MVDRLRERVLLGRYFGCWAPGDRLPSVRDVARLEDVDRKTAAAAYRRLEDEGLVRVEPRSGVYMGTDGQDPGSDPLRRLHRQWLEHTLASAGELGLTSRAIARMLRGVAVVESQRIPVVDDDPGHASLVARELAARTGLDCGACRPDQLPATTGVFRDAPFVVATPAATVRLLASGRRLVVVQATLAPELLAEVGEAARSGPVTVVVGTEGLERELASALEHGLVERASQVNIVRPTTQDRRESLPQDGAGVVLWPGAPEWVVERMNGEVRDRHRAPLLSSPTVTAIRREVARLAVDHVSRTSVS